MIVALAGQVMIVALAGGAGPQLVHVDQHEPHVGCSCLDGVPHCHVGTKCPIGPYGEKCETQLNPSK